MTRCEKSDRAAWHPRWRVWGFVLLAAAVGAMSAFTDSAVRTAEYKYGAAGIYGLDVRVWGVTLQRERVGGTRATTHVLAVARELQWRWVLAAVSALAAGGAVAAVAVARTRPGRGRRAAEGRR